MANDTIPNAALASLKNRQRYLAGYSQQALQFYNGVLANSAYKAFDELENWMLIFYKKAKIALKKAPQLREKLGMIER